jgi:hypothetical protein
MKALMHIKPALAVNSVPAFTPSIAAYPSIEEFLSAGLPLVRRFHMPETTPLHKVEFHLRYWQFVSEKVFHYWK